MSLSSESFLSNNWNAIVQKMNPLYKNSIKGAAGELLVQLRLLQYEVQAAPPLRDSGNDLIAIKGNIFKAIQVKTTIKHGGKPLRFDCKDLPASYHILALVALQYSDENGYLLDETDIYLVPYSQIGTKRYIPEKQITEFSLNQQLVDHLFAPDYATSSE